MGRGRLGADRVGFEERITRGGDRRDRRAVCQLPVLLRPGTRRGAGLLARGEPRHAWPPVRARGDRARDRRPRLGRLGRGGDLGPRGRRPYGSGRPRRPAVSETAPPGLRERIAYRAFATVGCRVRSRHAAAWSAGRLRGRAPPTGRTVPLVPGTP